METFLKAESWHLAFTAFNGFIAMNLCIVISLAFSGFLLVILTRDPDSTKRDDPIREAFGSEQPNKDKASHEESTRICEVSARAMGIPTADAPADHGKAPITDIREGSAPLTAIGRRTAP